LIPLVAAFALALQMPQLPQLPPIRRAPQITYLDRSGQVLGVRGGRYGPPVDIARLPAYVPAAFVAIEDRRFYEHAGFDPVGIARAIVADVSQGRAAEGASTITQQLARNLFLTDNRTLQRKATELVYAVELEQKFTKPQILGLYLSRVYFGSGAYGLEAAARRYYGRPAARLTLMQAATLAGVVQSPTYFDPADHPRHAAARARLVLDAMVETGRITPLQRARALARPPRVLSQPLSEASQYFIDWIDPQVRRLAGPALAGDVVVQTTLDLPMQDVAAADARRIVAAHARQDVQEAALVALDGAGAVRAMVGGVDYGSSQFNRAVDAHRQAGSSWKPFVYLAAMEAGQTPQTQVVDEPVTIDGWSPKDYEPNFLGQITLQQALAQSINTVAARLADQVGRPVVAADARRLGIVTPINTEPAMALGTSLVTPLEMGEAYDAFANGGDRVGAYGIEAIRTGAGRLVWRHVAAPPVPVIENPPLSELDQMMRAVVASGTGVGARIPGYDIAGKTGTASDYRDAWFCGFSGDFATVVWMGRDDDRPMAGVVGGGAPAELWRDFMRVALRRVRAGPIPPGRPAPPPPPVIAPAAPPTPPPVIAPAAPPTPPPPMIVPPAPSPAL